MQSISVAASPTPSNRVRMPVRVSWSQYADARLVQLHLEGLSLRAMAVAFCLSRSTIASRARQIGLTTLTRSSTKRVNALLLPKTAVDPNREPLPAGHPISWDLVTAGTSMAGEAYEYPRSNRYEFRLRPQQISQATGYPVAGRET